MAMSPGRDLYQKMRGGSRPEEAAGDGKISLPPYHIPPPSPVVIWNPYLSLSLPLPSPPPLHYHHYHKEVVMCDDHLDVLKFSVHKDNFDPGQLQIKVSGK